MTATVENSILTVNMCGFKVCCESLVWLSVIVGVDVDGFFCQGDAWMTGKESGERA